MERSIRTLFRYLTADAALKTIESKSFRVGRVLELNDPFEWRLGFSGLTEQNQSKVELFTERTLQHMNTSAGILCFSETEKDAVLWSHYADHHRGVAFEIDYLKGGEADVDEVIYTNERLCLNADIFENKEKYDLEDLEINEDFLKKLMLRKSEGWRYEKEYRFLVNLESCTVSNGHYLLSIPPDFIQRVILGSRCKLDEKTVRRTLDQNGFDYVKVARAKLSNETYDVLC